MGNLHDWYEADAGWGSRCLSTCFFDVRYSYVLRYSFCMIFVWDLQQKKTDMFDQNHEATCWFSSLRIKQSQAEPCHRACCSTCFSELGSP